MISSLPTRLGITALRAGSNRPHITVSAASSGNTSHTIRGERTSSMQVTMTARMMSVAIITCRRRKRSLTTPASGPVSACGKTCSTKAKPSRRALPVNSSSMVYSATM